MPWQRLQDWISPHPPMESGAPGPVGALTLVTLSLKPGSAREEARFYRDAELECLSRWLRRGELLFALTSLGHDELTLLCPKPGPAARALIEDLPLVASGLVTARLTAVSACAAAPDSPEAAQQ
jgi:hypothetical protein